MKLKTISIGCVHFVTLNVILLSTGGTNASCHSRRKILECGLVLSLCVQISAQTLLPMTYVEVLLMTISATFVPAHLHLLYPFCVQLSL